MGLTESSQEGRSWKMAVFQLANMKLETAFQNQAITDEGGRRLFPANHLEGGKSMAVVFVVVDEYLKTYF